MAVKIDLADYKKRIRQSMKQFYFPVDISGYERLDVILGDLVNEVEHVTKKEAEIRNRRDRDTGGNSGVDHHGRAVAEADDFRERMGEQNGRTDLRR